MNQSFSLIDPLAVSDLKVYLSRASRVEDGSVRLIAGSGVLAAYTAILYPHGLLDRMPTVLGLRTFATDTGAAFDAVVPVRSMLDRLARVESTIKDQAADAGGEPIGIRLPLEVSTVTWAGISPPRKGWRPVGETASETLEAAARAGIGEVAADIPEGTGEQIVQRVRAEVWGRPMDGLEYVPAGAGFAASGLGFIAGDEKVAVYETGPWTRLTLRRGHVLVRRQAWTLKP
ncbi:hypothetical protein OSC27_07880 [Microbacterium sp. STN6]|uniref:hypothetical protein n=1 Tax=Microbacterium sp. STN6 TaxID=2995588 RepID=UPI002260E940|nr:hypothetical protein [Microbacterium sp. STN6]MCX7522196.1 hypothetical protein [Microbacterium sp. STN6]